MRARLAALLLIPSIGLAACSATDTTPPPAAPTAIPAPTAAPAGSVTPTGASTTPTTPSGRPSAKPSGVAATPSAVPTISEPTTTNTLPAPPRPSKPAPSTAGRLKASSLPVPVGWQTIARPGGSEEGYEGNGTWVHARDPRYAAQAVITLLCTAVTRDDYTDPVHALEGDYTRGDGSSGVGLVLQFATADQARSFYRLYVTQVGACRTAQSPIQAKILPSRLGLIDQRVSPDGDWTEVAALSGSRLTLVILSDPGLRISRARSEALLRTIVS